MSRLARGGEAPSQYVQMSETTQIAPALPLRPQDEVECRRCEVHCEKVVYPSACLARSCPFAYAYEEHGHTFMGCMQKVFEAEIDVDMLHAAERRTPSSGPRAASANATCHELATTIAANPGGTAAPSTPSSVC